MHKSATPDDLKQLLKDMIRHYECFYVVVDALDECPDSCRHLILQTLKGLLCCNVKLILTSRELIDIKECLSEFKHIRISANVEDLELYVAAEIETRISNRRLFIKKAAVKEKIIDTLSHGADGM